MVSVLVSEGCRNKLPQLGGLRQQKCILSQFCSGGQKSELNYISSSVNFLFMSFALFFQEMIF